MVEDRQGGKKQTLNSHQVSNEFPMFFFSGFTWQWIQSSLKPGSVHWMWTETAPRGELYFFTNEQERCLLESEKVEKIICLCFFLLSFTPAPRQPSSSSNRSGSDRQGGTKNSNKGTCPFDQRNSSPKNVGKSLIILGFFVFWIYILWLLGPGDKQSHSNLQQNGKSKVFAY